MAGRVRGAGRILAAALVAAVAVREAPAGDGSKGAEPAQPKAPSAGGRAGSAEGKDAGVADDGAPARRAAIRRAVALLAAKAPGLADSEGTPRKPFTQATTGLVLLLDDATTETKSVLPELAASVARWLEKVERESRDQARLPETTGSFSSDRLIQYVWPTGQAALLFAEMDARGVHRDAARAGMRRCMTILGEARASNGGFGHGRQRPGGTSTGRPTLPGLPGGLVVSGGYPETLIAATNVASIGLGAVAAVPGLPSVPDLEPTRRHYRDAQLRNGSFPYDTSQRSADLSKTNAGRTAGALAAMAALAMPRDATWKRASDYVIAETDWMAEGHGSPCLNLMHAALAFRLVGDDARTAFRDRFGPALVASQREDGTLPCPCGKRAFGVTCDDPEATGLTLPAFAEPQRVYETALNAMTLLLLEGKTLRSLDRVPQGAVVTPGRTK
ncbi:MAG: hypothetical protein K8T90_02780 [Planctomycetes bacterium]|nr:hypothetical protein [Planctomycetota bacterium]